jgi:autotransporter-associated beta strand protein
VGSGGATGTLGTGAVVNDGALEFLRSDAVHVNGDISGTGSLTQSGTGTTVLTGTNTFSGGTTISAGTLQLGNGGTTGALIGDVANGGALVFNRSNTHSFGGVISGSGSLTQAGSGTTILAGNNLYSGTTTIAAGTLQVGAGGTTGALGTGGVVNNGTLAFDRRDAVVLSSDITGVGTLAQIGDGSLILTGANSYAGGTTILKGTLQVGDGGTTGSLGTGNVTNHGTLAFKRSDEVTVADDIAGSGVVAHLGTGRLTLTGRNSYTGGTIIAGGARLQVGNGGTTGSLGTGKVRNNGSVSFNRRNTLKVSGDISGAGSVDQIGSGTTVLTGTNTYAGMTRVKSGTLQVGDGGTRGTLGKGAIANNGSLVFNRRNLVTVNNEISGAGRLIQAGSGVLGLVGAKTYTGGTYVNSGSLALEGSLASSVFVAEGAAFTGTGSIDGELRVDGSLGVGSAADPFGTLTVGVRKAEEASTAAGLAGRSTGAAAAAVTLAPGAHLNVSIDAAGNHPVLVSEGRALVDGASILIDPTAGLYGRVTFYPVVQAHGGLTGRANVTSTSAALQPLVTATSHSLVVAVLNTEVPLASFGTTDNGVAIAEAFDRLKGEASGDLARVARELALLDDAGLARALDTVAGEVHASAPHVAAVDGEAQSDLVRQELASRFEFDVASTPRGWTRLLTERAVNRRGTSHGVESSVSGFAAGVDRTLANRWLVGIGGGYTRGTLVVDDLGDSSSYEAQRAFGYASYRGDEWMANLGGSLARSAYEIRRTLVFGAHLPEELGGVQLLDGVNSVATSAPRGTATDVWAEWVRPTRLANWGLRPHAAVRYASYGRRAWTESGADALSLSAPAQAIATATTEVGLHAARSAGRFRPEAGMTYRRLLNDGQTAAALQLADGVDGLFRVRGQRFVSQATTIVGGLGFRANRFASSVTYHVRHAAGHQQHGIQFSLSF